MALTPNLGKVRVTGSFADSQGNPNTGTIRFQLSTYLVDPIFNQTVTNAPITVQLVNGQIVDGGQLGVLLVATNDPDLYPAVGSRDSVVWNVTESLNGLGSRSYTIRLDYTWQFFDLADRFDLLGNLGVGTGSQGNVGGIGSDGNPTNPGGGTTNPGTGTAGPHAATHAIGGSDPVTPASIGAAPLSEVQDRINGDATLRADLNAALVRIGRLEGSTPTTPTAPGAPTNAVGVAGDGRLTVSFVAPVSNGGSPITGYRVGLSNGQTVTGTSSPIVVTGLANGVEYYATVVAFNAAGTSSPSNTVGPLVPTGTSSATTPGAPTGVSAAAGAGQATVSFTAPSSSGGAAIVSYLVTASTGQTASGTSSPITVTGLTNGTAVTFTVAAINSVGSSPQSNPSSQVIPLTTPGVPTNISATGGNTSAVVTFNAPAGNGGSPVIDYTVTASTGQTVTGTSSPITVTGLTNGVAVSFTVRARNVVGYSQASASSGQVTPLPPQTGADTPSAPTNVTVTVGATSNAATVQWGGPVSVGSSAVTNYRLTRVDQSGVAATPITVSSSTLTYTWSGLTVGQTYTFGVSAINAVGTGTSSTVIATIPAASSGSTELLTTQQSSVETTDLSGFSVNGTGITLSRDSAWSGSGTYSLRVTSSAGVANSSGVNVERIPVAPGKQYQFTATMLRGTDKTVGVVFKWRDSNNNALSNDAIATFDGFAGNTQTLTQTGTAPTGAAFLRVTVQYATASVSSIDYFNLDNLHVTELGTGPGGGTVTTPGKPEQVSVTPDGDTASVTVNWSYNTSGTGSDATRFRVGRDGTDSTGSGPYQTDVALTTSTFTFTKLVPGQTYTFSVWAVNDAGVSPPYTATLVMPSPSSGTTTTYPSDSTYPSNTLYPGDSAGGGTDPTPTGDSYPGSTTYAGSNTYPGTTGTTTPTVTAPGAPTGVAVTSSATDRKPTVTWAAPSSNGGAAISGYVVNWTANDGTTGSAQTVSGATTSYTYAASFAASAVVTFTVRAVNSAGQSAAGSVTYTFPAATTSVPGQVASLVASSAASGEVTITWAPPASDGGSAVTGYLAGRDGTDATGYGPWTTPTPLASSVRSQTFTQLVVGRSYTFTASAVNANGTGASRSVTFTVPAPAPSTSVSTVSGVNSLTVNWTLPAGTTGSVVTLNNSGGTSGTLGATVNSRTFTGLTNGTTYTATVTVTVSGGQTATATATGTPTAAAAGSNPLNFKRFTIGANVTGAANGEFNTWIGKKHGQYSTWGGSNESPYWDGGAESKRGRPWGILGATAEYGSNAESRLGQFDVDVAPQFGPRSWVAAGNGTEAGYEAFIRTRLQEFKAAWGNRAGDCNYRPFHEFNGDWYGWSVRNTADQDGFRNAWIRMRAIWNEVMAGDTRFKLVWSPNRDSKYGLDVRRCWPGKQYADIIGVDYYDYAVSRTGTEADWAAEYNRTQNGGGPVGIGAWQAFAQTEGVPLALPEWGEQFGDNLFFLQKMKAFYDANYYSGTGSPAGKVLYCGWHNLYAPGGTVDPNATSGNFLIQQNAADYSGRPQASPYWRQYCQNTSYLRWLP